MATTTTVMEEWNKHVELSTILDDLVSNVYYQFKQNCGIKRGPCWLPRTQRIRRTWQNDYRLIAQFHSYVRALMPSNCIGRTFYCLEERVAFVLAFLCEHYQKENLDALHLVVTLLHCLRDASDKRAAQRRFRICSYVKVFLSPVCAARFSALATHVMIKESVPFTDEDFALA